MQIDKALDQSIHTTRIFMGGLSKDITCTDLESRCSTFGTITDLQMSKKGFAHLSLTTTQTLYQKCNP